MSRFSRSIYLILLAVSVAAVWLAVRTMQGTPGVSARALTMLLIAMATLGWLAIRGPVALPGFEESAVGRRMRQLFAAAIEPAAAYPVMILGILLGIAAAMMAHRPGLEMWPATLAWLGGLIFFVVGVASNPQLPSIRLMAARASAALRHNKAEVLAVCIIAVFAIIVRVPRLDQFPRNIHGDEAEMGMIARSVLDGSLRDPFAAAWLGHPTLWFFMQAGSLRLFGDNMEGLRLLSALLGSVTVLVFYAYGRQSFGRQVALVSSGLLAAFHFHVHFSRVGLNNVADPLMALLTFGTSLYAIEHRSRRAAALTGVLMGLAQYFYFSAHLIPLIVLVLLIHWWVRHRRDTAVLFQQAALMGLGFVLAVAPLTTYYISHPIMLSNPLARRSFLYPEYLTGLQTSGQSISSVFWAHAYRSIIYFVGIDEIGPFYNSGIPLLSHGMEVLFVIGLVVAIVHVRSTRHFALVAWLTGVVVLGGVLLWQEQESQRFLIAAPVLCLLTGMGLVELGKLLTQVLPESLRRTSIGIAAITLALVAWNTHFYFKQYSARNIYARTNDATELAFYLRDRQGEVYVYMFTPPAFYLGFGTLRFVADNPPGVDMNVPLSAIEELPEAPPGLQPVFVFNPARLGELDVVKQRYPSGDLIVYRTPNQEDRILYYLYEPGS